MSDETTDAMSSVARFAAMRRLQEAGADWGNAAQELQRQPRRTDRRTLFVTMFAILAVAALAMFGMGLGSETLHQWRSASAEGVAPAPMGAVPNRVAFLDETVDSLQAFEADDLVAMHGMVLGDGPSLATSAYAVEVAIDAVSTPGVLKIEAAVRDVVRDQVCETRTVYKTVTPAGTSRG